MDAREVIRDCMLCPNHSNGRDGSEQDERVNYLNHAAWCQSLAGYEGLGG